jgi:4'-phosphopantetheinyl transferase
MGLSLETCDVHIHYRSTGRISPEEHAQALRILSSDEVERAQRFVFSRDRVVFVAAHMLLRQALSEYEDVPSSAWTFAADLYGKPMLAERFRSSNLSFNLSHTSGLVACVICRRRDVGIDVESLDREVDWREIASRFFSAREVTSLDGSVKSDEHAHFTELWTLKEAYIKAIGTGLSHPLHTFSFVYTGATSLRFEPAVRDEQSAWQFALFAPTARHRMAVAAGRTGRETLRMTTWGEQSGGSARMALRTSV